MGIPTGWIAVLRVWQAEQAGKGMLPIIGSYVTILVAVTISFPGAAASSSKRGQSTGSHWLEECRIADAVITDRLDRWHENDLRRAV